MQGILYGNLEYIYTQEEVPVISFWTFMSYYLVGYAEIFNIVYISMIMIPWSTL